MYSINILCSGFLLISTASTLAIAPSQTLFTLTPGPSSIANLTADAQVNGQANLTLDGSSQNGVGSYDIECSAAVYGRGLRRTSCASAISSFIQPFGGWVTIGPRGKGKAYNYVLPWRWISDDGRCIIDIVTQEKGADGMALPTQLTDAATALVNQCVVDGIGIGGMVYGVGWNSKFALAVRPFEPSHVVCDETRADPPFTDGCEDMLQTMLAGINERDTFGPAGAPGVTVDLPFVEYSDMPNNCALAITMEPGLPALTVDSDRWYDIWGDAVAIQGMCVRQGFEGSFVLTGEHGRLNVWLLVHTDEEAVVFPNATLGTMLASNTQTLSTNLEMPSPIQSVSSS